jgi:hypothetical protein
MLVYNFYHPLSWWETLIFFCIFVWFLYNIYVHSSQKKKYITSYLNSREVTSCWKVLASDAASCVWLSSSFYKRLYVSCQVNKLDTRFFHSNEKDFALREIILNEIKSSKESYSWYKRQNASIELLYPDLLRCQSP